MKFFFTNRLRFILRVLARLTINKYGPSIIAVTGSVGKSSAKEAVFSVLSGDRRARAAPENFNNEIGVPLAILGSWQKIEKPVWRFWAKVIVSAVFRLVFRRSYPEILVLEYAADRPGDMKYLLEIAKPNVGVITAVGDVPVHVEFYEDAEAVAREKSKLVETLSSLGFAVLNFDDPAVFTMRERTRARVVTFGFSEGADVRITNFENRSEKGRPTGIFFKLEHGGSFVPVKIDETFGKVQAYAAAAAAAVGLIFNVNLVKISELLAGYRPLKGRMRLVPGVKRTWILDDSYNASPLSMRAAIETLRDLEASRKVAVLGDMLEIGKYAVEAHQAIGDLAARTTNILVTVGPRAKFIAEAALSSGLASSNVLAFDTAEEALKPLQKVIKKGDLILVKASHSIALNKVVEEIIDQRSAI